MGPLTADRPKCLTELAGKTLLSWQLSALKAAGIQNVAVVRGYAAQCLPGETYEVIDNPRWEHTNMVTSLRCAAPYLERETCAVSYADIVYHPDTLRRLIAGTGDIVLTYDRLWRLLWQDRFDDPLKDAETFRTENGRLIEIGARTTDPDDIQGQYMGLLKITPVGWRQIASLLNSITSSQRDQLDVTALLSRLIDTGIVIGTVPVDGRWCEVDSPSDHSLYRARVAGNAEWGHDWRW